MLRYMIFFSLLLVAPRKALFGQAGRTRGKNIGAVIITYTILGAPQYNHRDGHQNPNLIIKPLHYPVGQAMHRQKAVVGLSCQERRHCGRLCRCMPIYCYVSYEVSQYRGLKNYLYYFGGFLIVFIPSILQPPKPYANY